jgi:transcriptional regulator with XRE-family HTH domain
VRLANRLRERREAAGLSRMELATRSGVTRQTIWNIETGRAQPETATIFRLAQALEEPWSSLFWAEPAPKPERVA